MLYFSRLKAAAILLTALVVCSFAVPNFFNQKTVQSWPKWAQRHIVLGLDLQGGVHILLEVDTASVRKEKVETLRDDVRRVVRENRLGSPATVTIRGSSIEFRPREGVDQQVALTKLRELSQPLGGILSGTGQRTVDVVDAGGVIRLTPTEPALIERIRQSVEQSIQILERRLNEIGTVEPTIQRQGVDRILIQVPGLQDPERLKALLGQTAKLQFRLVCESQPQVAGERPPVDCEEVPDLKNPQQMLWVQTSSRATVDGEDLTDAQPTFDNRTNEPIVSFRFNQKGALRFGKLTQENVGRPFAIVLDNKVVSAPVINEPILGGTGQISGRFTTQEANDLAIVLRSGALPARLTVVEERTVGPSLGSDSIRAGVIATVIGTIGVVVFMLVGYGFFGLIANIGLLAHLSITVGLLSVLGATLTLPGIAGLLLTLGMAVDSNVLVYERIREESRAGRSPVNAIETGFRAALATIVDANMTTMIAVVVLFMLGSGPVRGFAVTLGIGTATTVFTAFTFSRLIIAYWLWSYRPKVVPL